MNKLLIQACSGRKIYTPKVVPALELYDGVAFRVIKKALRENPELRQHLTILILSAEYGLISAEREISYYDRRMTKERSVSLKTQTTDYYGNFILDKSFEKVFVNVGNDYLTALNLIRFPDSTKFASGGIGYRNQQLKHWLLEDYENNQI